MLDKNGVGCVPFLNILMANSPKGNDSTVFSLVFMNLKYESLVFDKLMSVSKDQRIHFFHWEYRKAISFGFGMPGDHIVEVFEENKDE